MEEEVLWPYNESFSIIDAYVTKEPSCYRPMTKPRNKSLPLPSHESYAIREKSHDPRDCEFSYFGLARLGMVRDILFSGNSISVELGCQKSERVRNMTLPVG